MSCAHNAADRAAEPLIIEKSEEMTEFDAFISYATEDLVFASEIAGALKAQGLRIWTAELELKAGERLLDAIEGGLQQSSCGILLITKAYLQKPWTNFEMDALIRQSIESNKQLLPIWHGVDKEDVERRHIGLAGIFALHSIIGHPRLIQELLRAMAPSPVHFDSQIKAGIGFNYHDILDNDTQELIIIAQNLRTFIRHGIHDTLYMLLRDRPSFFSTIILTVPEFFSALSANREQERAYQMEFADTIWKLNQLEGKLTASQQRRLSIRFHPGASSLSALIRDPSDKRRGLLVFSPKWATDIEPDNRVYCIVERSIQEHIFTKFIGHISQMAAPPFSIGLTEMIARVKEIGQRLEIQ